MLGQFSRLRQPPATPLLVQTICVQPAAFSAPIEALSPKPYTLTPLTLHQSKLLTCIKAAALCHNLHPQPTTLSLNRSPLTLKQFLLLTPGVFIKHASLRDNLHHHLLAFSNVPTS